MSSVTLYSPDGAPTALLRAETLTAFRTALASTILLVKRGRVRTLTVFGSGSQAYWHIRLALLLRGDTIRTVNIINRRFSDGAEDLLRRFHEDVSLATKRREGWDAARFSLLALNHSDFPLLLKSQLREADAVYCCTSSASELFDASILTNRGGRLKGRLIVAVGSQDPSMRELPRDLLLQAVRSSSQEEGSTHRHFHKHAEEGGVVVVDTVDGALHEAGELIDAGLGAHQLVEYATNFHFPRRGFIMNIIFDACSLTKRRIDWESSL